VSSAPQINRSMNPLEWGLLGLLSILFGSSFFFIGVAVKELPTFTIVVIRVAIAAAILLVVMRVMGTKIPRGRQIWAAFFAMALLNNVIPFSMIVWGQEQVASGVAAILNASTPLFGVVVAHWLTTDEKMTPARILGVIIGFSGVIVMIGIDAFQSLGLDLLAPLAIVMATLSYALASVYGRRFKRYGVKPISTAAGQITASTLILIPIALIIDQPWTLAMPGMETIGAVLGLAALSTALASVVYFRILATAGANNVLLVTFLLPITAILLGAVLLNEVLLPRHVPGIVLIGFGLAVLDGRLWKMVRSIGN
jgi:drug/metabolite transporter (DMT)-like permease